MLVGIIIYFIMILIGSCLIYIGQKKTKNMPIFLVGIVFTLVGVVGIFNSLF